MGIGQGYASPHTHTAAPVKAAFVDKKRPNMLSKRVMIVDDYDPTIELLAEVLESEGYTPICHTEECLSVTCITDARADLLILELGLGEPNGMLQLLHDLRQHPSTWALPVIVNSTDDQLLAELADELSDLSCAAVSKPFDLEVLLRLVGTCLSRGANEARADLLSELAD